MRRAGLLLGSLIALAVAPPASAANGPVASWPFDEGSGTVVHDTSGHGSDGLISGNVQWVSGFSGSALNFDGLTGRVRVHDSPSLDPTSAVSAGAWIRAIEPQGDFNYILAKGASGCLAASYGLYTGPNAGVMFYVAQNKGLSYTRSPDGGSRVWDGRWHFVVGTYDGSSVRLYLDGKQVGSGSPHVGPIDYDFPDNDLFIGHYNTCPAFDFTGSIDDAQVWGRALTGSEISDIYEQFIGGSDGGGLGSATAPPSRPTASGPTTTGPATSGSGTSVPTGLTGASVSGLSNGKPQLVVRVLARPPTSPIKSFTVTLPSGLRFVQNLSRLRKGVSLTRGAHYSLALSGGRLVVVFKAPQRSVSLTIREPALIETSSLVKRVQAIVKFNRMKPRAKKKVLELQLGMRLTDVQAKTASVHTVLRVS